MYTDNELICMARCGDESAEDMLAARYIKLVRICARPYFLVGGDSEDLIQEGMLGLLSAIRKFDCDGAASFKTYAQQCIHHRIISAVESASRFKHQPLNQGLSLESMKEDRSSSLHTSDEQVFVRQTEEQVLAKEQQNEVFASKIETLSKFEKQVLVRYLGGLSYKEIGFELNKSEKSVDNAVQRIRKKFARND